MCLLAGADTRHLPGQSRLTTQAANKTSRVLRSQSNNTQRKQRREQSSKAPWELSTAGSHQRSDQMDASSGPEQALPCLACHSSCCWLAGCTAAKNRSQCGDQGGTGAHQRGLTQSCLLPQCCGSGTVHRWKTEEGEWVIMRVLAPFCPHKKRA